MTRCCKKSVKEKDATYVYIGYSDGVCVYVGEGKYGRWEHLNSGVSHIYQANSLHFSGKVIDVEVLGGTFSKKDARIKEKQLIEELEPLWNVINTDAYQKKKELKRLSREFGSNKKTNKFKFLLDVSDHIQSNGEVNLNQLHCQCKPAQILYYYNLGDSFLNTIINSMERTERGKYKFQMSDIFIKHPRRFYKFPK